MRLGSFFVTYNRPRILKQSIQRILDQTRPPDLVLIVDNFGSRETEDIVANLNDRRIVYRPMGKNLGSAGGTAFGIQWVYEQGFDYIYCGDDDDPPKTADTIERLVKILVASGSDVGGAAAVGASWDWEKGELKRFPDNALRGLLDVDMVGGNGQLILTREVVESVGTYDGDLFFGYPDLEYSLRIRRAGFRLLVDGELMSQYRAYANRLGLTVRSTPRPRRSYAGIWRNYYTTRNYIYMMRRTFRRPDLARREALKAIGKSVGSWTHGFKYGAAFTSLALRGIVDGYLDRRGRSVMPRPKYSR